MTTKALGQEGFRWFIGVVEDRDDPEMLGRVRVRIYNVHSELQSRTSTDELPWAGTMGPANTGSYSQIGHSPTGIQVGSTVIGFFLDGNDGNIPIIIGVLPGIPGNIQANHDVPFEARGINKVQKSITGPEPDTSYAAKYPYNKVMRTERGHVVEIDDTPGKERIHIFHTSGTYVEINQDGRMTTKIVNDDIEVIVGSKELYVNGDVNVQINGSYTLNVTGDIVMNGKTVNINKGTMGAARIGDSVPDSEIDGSMGIGEGSGTVFIGD